ncbi:MAG: hypothetical protein KDJ65_01555 [Anaerolineae bacterium]|nr:hypothetical protein [Anaerolineae bacterium]
MASVDSKAYWYQHSDTLAYLIIDEEEAFERIPLPEGPSPNTTNKPRYKTGSLGEMEVIIQFFKEKESANG